jgi:hypothetical protein
MKGDALAGSRECPPNRRQRRGPNECVSRLQHALDASVHLFFFDEFTSCYLVDANLDLLLEPLVMGKELGNGLLHQIIGSTSAPDSELVKLGFLIWR